MPTPTASGIYHKGNLALAKGEISRLSNTLQIIFLDTTHVIDAVNDDIINDIVSGEVGTIARQTLTGKTLDNSTASNVAKFDGSNIALTGITGDFKHIVLAKFDTADNNANSKLIAYWTFADQSASNQDININFAATGITTETV